MVTAAKRDGRSLHPEWRKDVDLPRLPKRNLAMVTVKTNPATKNHQKDSQPSSLTCIPKGSRQATFHGKLGVRAGSTGWIFLTDVKVPAGEPIGEEGEGFKIHNVRLSSWTLYSGIWCDWIIRSSLEASVITQKTRKTFGRPIAEHQLNPGKDRQNVTGLRNRRLLYRRPVWLKNLAMLHTRRFSFAKKFATEAFILRRDRGDPNPRCLWIFR